MTPQSRDDLEQEHKAVLRIPYALTGVIAMLVGQTLTAVWWASGLQVKMDLLQDQVRSLAQMVADGRKDGMTATDGTRLFNDLQNKILDHEHRIRDLEKRAR